ncbi:hypothetical protein LXL04_006178 [Taraxacum kok-saghyz]
MKGKQVVEEGGVSGLTIGDVGMASLVTGEGGEAAGASIFFNFHLPTGAGNWKQRLDKQRGGKELTGGLSPVVAALSREVPAAGDRRTYFRRFSPLVYSGKSRLTPLGADLSFWLTMMSDRDLGVTLEAAA